MSPIINYDLPQSSSFIKVKMVGDNRHGVLIANKKKALRQAEIYLHLQAKVIQSVDVLGHIFRRGVYLCLEVRSEEWQSVHSSSNAYFIQVSLISLHSHCQLADLKPLRFSFPSERS